MCRNISKLKKILWLDQPHTEYVFNFLAIALRFLRIYFNDNSWFNNATFCTIKST